MLLQQIISGVLASGIYALFAVGFTMIFGIMNVLNMAHADFAMVAAFAVISAVASGFNPVEAVAFAAVITIAIAVLLERFALRRGRQYKGDAATEMPLIATIGAGMVLQNGAALIFGNKSVAFPWQMWSFVNIGGMFLTQGLIVSMIVAVLLLAALEALVNMTDFGRQMRAVAQNSNAAKIMGINTDRVVVLTMALSALLAAIAGCLVGISYGVLTPYMGLSYTIKGLVAMIIGGVGSLRGAMMGALLIGVVEALAVTWLGSQSRDTTVFLILLATLLIRPAGLVRTAGMK